MQSIKVVTIIGARPQFVKAAAVSRAFSEYNRSHSTSSFSEVLVHTGQHYDANMSQVFFDELHIPKPDYNLGVGSGSHGEQTGLMLQRIEDVLLNEKPNTCLVYGDTNSTLAGALAAAKLHIPVAHVEAGLRSFNRNMPEEINRIMADHISSFLFCPSETAVKNLSDEGIANGVHQIGDVMYDCVRYYIDKNKSTEQSTLSNLNIHSKSFYLATVHRAENTNDQRRLTGIMDAFSAVAAKDCPIILPLHPRTIAYLEKYNLKISRYVRIIPPVSYLEMLALQKNARKILTDSGGVQKEAYWLDVPCVTLRNETEWVETVQSGWNTLTGADKEGIIEAVQQPQRENTAVSGSLYGNGDAAIQICNILVTTESDLKSMITT
jgi:UDP-GlcNAc3NAcA epimerase